MNKSIYFNCLKNTLFTALIAMIFCTNNAVAQDDLDVTECPYFTVNTTDTAGVAFPLLSTNVSATISGVIASVEIEQVYQNSGEQPLDATYIFPMSTNAAVYSMQMILDGRIIDAEIKERAEAQQIFDDANAAGQTATLLDQQRPNVFQMSLANIQPSNVLVVKMKYTELIEPEKGTYQFVFPTIVGPRFTNGTEEWVFQSINDSLSVANTAFNVDLTINAGMEVTAECTSHNTEFINDGETARCSLATTPGKDFIVDYSLDGNKIETGLLLYEGEEENFFLAMMQPPKADIMYDSPQREYVFIMDISGSMTGEPLEISKAMISNLLDDLNSDDRFNIVFFAGGSKVFSPNSLPVTPQNINSALTFIDNLDAGGGTQLLAAMQTALGMQGTADYSRSFVILTDGLVTVEKEAYELIRQNLNDANFFSFGIGAWGINREIIEGIAYVGEGESFAVTDLANAQNIADTFREYIERPALTNINAEFANINVYDVEPLSIPDVFADRPVIIYGKYDNSNSGTLTLTGDRADTQVSSTLYFPDYAANADENIAIKYLWARKRIKLMSDYGIASNENDTLTVAEEVTQLGLQYGLVTEYTSFVAVDTAAVTTVNEPSNTGGISYDTSFGFTPGASGPVGPSGGAPPPAPGAPGVSVDDQDSSTITIDNNAQIFTTYPWVNNYFNNANCNGESVSVYNSGNYNYILIQNGSEGKLYFEDGTFYCNQTSSFSCLDAYGLTNATQTWNCGGGNPTPAPTISGCTDATATNYNASATVYDGSCQYQTTNTNSSAFTSYSWLNTYVNQNNCNGETVTVYDAGSYDFILIQNGNEAKLYFEDGTFYCSETASFSCVTAYGLNNVAQTWTCGNSAPSVSGCMDASATNYNAAATVDDGSCQYQTTNTNSSAFTSYSWLSTYVNQNNCNGEKITVYDAGSYDFILIQNGNESKLYFEDGTFYCSETASFSCITAYGLNNIAQTWTCGNTTSIRGCTDASATNFNSLATVDDGSCEFLATDCASNTGTFFYKDCGGDLYFFIRLDDGKVFDPYFAEGIGFEPREGQQIHFNYVINTTVTTPCTVSESPITITCYEEITGTVFEDYTWLSTKVNENNCDNESITVYDGGGYHFILIQNADGSTLYYQDGTYYCRDAAGFSCVSAYNLRNVVNTWSCRGTNKQANANNLSAHKTEAPVFKLYPNPTTDNVFVKFTNTTNPQEIRLINISGKTVQKIQTAANESLLKIDVSHLPKGIYMVELELSNQNLIEKLIIK